MKNKIDRDGHRGSDNMGSSMVFIQPCQKILKKEMEVLLPGVNNFNPNKVGKFLRNQASINEQSRSGSIVQMPFTMVDQNTNKSVRHQTISRKAAKDRNFFNACNGIPFRWVQGRQKIESENL